MIKTIQAMYAPSGRPVRVQGRTVILTGRGNERQHPRGLTYTVDLYYVEDGRTRWITVGTGELVEVLPTVTDEAYAELSALATA